MVNTQPIGLIFIDKPYGWTSHDVVAKTRKIFATKKVGHAGTLDPMATGLLILGLGRATKLMTHLIGESKSYEATIRLGQTTTTDDAEGTVTSRTSVQHYHNDLTSFRQQLLTVIEAMKGPQLQVPASVSAKKINGQRAYDLVRQGKTVVLNPVPIVISTLSVDEIVPTDDAIDIKIHVDCSAGTYIRALARDIGESLKVGGHLTSLRRTAIGNFSVEKARTIDQLTATVDVNLDQLFENYFPIRILTKEQAQDLSQGKRIPAANLSGVYAGVTAQKKAVALLTEDEGLARSVFVASPQ